MNRHLAHLVSIQLIPDLRFHIRCQDLERRMLIALSVVIRLPVYWDDLYCLQEVDRASPCGTGRRRSNWSEGVGGRRGCLVIGMVGVVGTIILVRKILGPGANTDHLLSEQLVLGDEIPDRPLPTLAAAILVVGVGLYSWCEIWR